jgi:hypothetical protein
MKKPVFMAVLSIIPWPNFLPHSVSISLSRGALHQVIPLHDQEQLKKLRNKWVGSLFKRQPIGEFGQRRIPCNHVPIGHEDSVGLFVCKAHIFATRWRIY